ncbi:DUF3383 domain-containing protein [Ruminococcaceae bacterium OttesenSCG-928-I18]|nr:DUF3383 domain-containing protein [Ruminococcaceae bacterium OttesenSCG-928-I18]
MALDVKVNISVERLLTGAGDWVPLLFAGGQDVEVPYTLCQGLEDVEKLFPKTGKVYAAAARIFSQGNAPDYVAVYGATGNAVAGLPAVWDEGWRQLVVAQDDGTPSTPLEVAAHVEENSRYGAGKVYFPVVTDLADVDFTPYERTFALYHPDEVDCPEAAVVGATAGKAVGTITYKNQMIAGVEPAALAEQTVKDAADKGCYCILRKAGSVVTSEGKVGNGEYLDILDGRDYVVQEIEYNTQQLLNSADKVPYDNTGIAMLEAACVEVMVDAYGRGIIDSDDDGSPMYSVDYGPRSDTSLADRKARRYTKGYFSFTQSEAVHEAVVNGTIVI